MKKKKMRKKIKQEYKRVCVPRHAPQLPGRKKKKEKTREKMISVMGTIRTFLSQRTKATVLSKTAYLSAYLESLFYLGGEGGRRHSL